MSELPRFTTPFKTERSGSNSKISTNASGSPRSGSPESDGPPRAPSWKIPKRLSIVALLDNFERKPSTVDVHGDLKQELARKKKKKFLIKWLSIVSIFLVGLMAGAAIGHWAIPRAVSSSVSTEAASATSSALSSLSDAVVDVEQKAAAGSNSNNNNNNNNNYQKQNKNKNGGGNSVATSTTTSAKSAAPQQTKATVKINAVSASASPQATAAGVYWQPTAGTGFQIMLSAVIKTSQIPSIPANVTALETDLFDTPAATIAALKAAGKKVICYFSAGTAEDWRTDYANFTSADIGAAMNGWPGENWVDTRSTNVRNIMAARLALAKQKGCDAVDPDNVDVYSYTSEQSGIAGLTTLTSIDYLTYLSKTSHSLGLAIGLKNAGDILPTLQPIFQFSVSESCVEYNECSIYQPFVTANKPAFNIQYPFGTDNSKSSVTAAQIKKYCTGTANIKGFTIILKRRNLDAWIYQC